MVDRYSIHVQSMQLLILYIFFIHTYCTDIFTLISHPMSKTKMTLNFDQLQTEALSNVQHILGIIVSCILYYIFPQSDILQIYWIKMHTSRWQKVKSKIFAGYYVGEIWYICYKIYLFPWLQYSCICIYFQGFKR